MTVKAEDVGKIVSDPAIMMGKPTIRGTRITVEHVVRMFEDGHDEASILNAHPHLCADDIRAARAHTVR